MRLLRLYIHEYRVLKELDISFDPDGRPEQSKTASDNIFKRNYHLDFLVGVNGTGKSTVLRLLGRIFRQSFDELRDLPFILEYYREQDKKTIRIANIDPVEYTPLESFSIAQADGLPKHFDEAKVTYADALDPALLPERIIAYTTGSENEWFALDESDPFQQSDPEAIQGLDAKERTYQELPGWSAIPDGESRQEGRAFEFRFIWQEQLPLVALAGFLLHSTKPNSPLSKVLQEADIEKLAGFSLQFNLAHSNVSEHRDIRQIFGQSASRAIRNGGTLLLVFQPDKFPAVLEASGGALAFFERLADWQRRETPLLVKANLFLERTFPKDKEHGEEEKGDTPPLHTWDWLSDGERSFIGRMCLFMLFGEVESLILLDEPEVHFNDYWKRHIVSLMSKVFESKNKAFRSHVLVATHSSIALSDVPREDVIVLDRTDFSTSRTRPPNIQTFGADPSDIMVHVFGAPFASGDFSTGYIREQICSADLSNPKHLEHLENMLKTVAPGYWHYRVQLEIDRCSKPEQGSEKGQ